jgi:uncharacterized protein (DUF433 family)
VPAKGASVPISWPEYLTDVDGERRFAGTRIGIRVFLHFYNVAGYSAEMIASEFPSIDLATIHKFIAFYLDHTAEIDAFVAAEQSSLDQFRATASHHVSLSELRKRLVTRPKSASA